MNQKQKFIINKNNLKRVNRAIIHYRNLKKVNQYKVLCNLKRLKRNIKLQ